MRSSVSSISPNHLIDAEPCFDGNCSHTTLSVPWSKAAKDANR